MDQAIPASNTSRRNEDIALDLLKFVVTTTGTGKSVSATTGFVASSTPKGEDQVEQLLDLYSRCLKAVQSQGGGR